MDTSKKWEILEKFKTKDSKLKTQDIVKVLLNNRGIRTKKEKEEFFEPTPPEKISLRKLDIKTTEVNKAIKRLSKARQKKEKVIVFGDYDADGVCATAILWECLYDLGLNVLPYIPERFSEGYGLKVESINKLKKEHPDLKLIITVDNGIVANEAVDEANKLGIDVIITDHHVIGKKLPKTHSIIHTTQIGGAGIAWIFTREIKKKLTTRNAQLTNGLELAAIGTIADQLPLIGPNRSFAKYGLVALNKTKRVGLLALFEEAGIRKGRTRLRQGYGGQVGTYEVGFIIAPRINAMGRLEHAIDSLRLLCTKNKSKAKDLAVYLGKTNRERQRVVEEVVMHAKTAAEKRSWEGMIVLAHGSYHEGVIGLAASKLVEEYWRPAIVLSKGESHSKASARSIPGFNIIKVIRELDSFLVEVGGHTMAAGFSIETKRIDKFSSEIQKVSRPLLTDEVLARRLRIDVEIDFKQISWKLFNKIADFDPTGLGNPRPTFVSKNINVLNARTVGVEGRHLKLTLEQNEKVFYAIGFGMGDHFLKLTPDNEIDIVYTLEENVWNNQRSIELKLKDLKISS